jgi:predicted 3-demethylubiquinone-9 3-methyltransferase (glyoxalase superfamily)
MSNIKLCLWFDGQAEEAAEFYVATFKACGRDAAMGDIARYGASGGPKPKGTALMAEFTLDGQPIMGLNGGPHYTFSPAISLFVTCADQAEVDHFWNALTADGGEPGKCGWLTDRFGVSWQIVPRALGELMKGPDQARAGRVMQAMMPMTKLDVAVLKKAYDGD